MARTFKLGNLISPLDRACYIVMISMPTAVHWLFLEGEGGGLGETFSVGIYNPKMMAKAMHSRETPSLN